MTALRIGLAQIDARIGDLNRNAGRLMAAVESIEARGGADLIVAPELALTGYPPRDLLNAPGFVRAAEQMLRRLAQALDGAPPLLVGTIWPSPERARCLLRGHPGLYSAAALLRGGRVDQVYAKQLLPAYDVFHEPRWFVPGPASALPLELGAARVGPLICEDLWDVGYDRSPPAAARAAGADLLVCLSASPFRLGALDRRLAHARRAGGPLVYVNAVGANDELIFDGRSFVLSPDGAVLAALPAHREAVEIVEAPLADRGGPEGVPFASPSPGSDAESALLCGALEAGIRSFFDKNRVRDAWLGLSGGVDSAVVAALAARALGPGRVRALAMPGRYTDPRSTEAARQLAAALGVPLDVHPIGSLHDAAERDLASLLADAPDGDSAAENLQARLRTLILSAHVNRRGGLLLNTSNKTELALGYGTLYADLAGTLSPLGDLSKPRVYQLARYINRAAPGEGPIPDFVIERLPTAELRPDQVDPFDYDAIAPQAEAAALGRSAPPEVAQRVHRAEHKRWQSGVILKVTERAFGTGRLIPVTRAPPA